MKIRYLILFFIIFSLLFLIESIIAVNFSTFSGGIPKEATNYNNHSLNITASLNSTSVVINLTGWAPSQDVDLFLFDESGELKAKSINKNTSEWLVYNYLPSSDKTWEIRIYGNSSNVSGIPYNGFIIFGTLNMTNASNTNQRIDLINFTSIFGNTLNVSNISSITVQLKNEGNVSLNNVTETKELYYVKRFEGSGSQNISLLVPNSSIAEKLKISLSWNGGSNYSFNVYKPNGSLSMSSMNKFKYANITNATQEEYNETTDIGSTGGYWRIEIRNNANVEDNYTLTAFIYVNASKWMSSNFSTFNFNTTGLENSTYIAELNLTAQDDMLDGRYEGHVQYRANSGAVLRIPVEVGTKTAMLMINNNLGSSTIWMNENIGANLTKFLNITYNNTGSYPLSLSSINSNGILNLSSANKNISFTYDAPSNILPNGNGTINITIKINTTLTGNTPGLYEGWITFITDDSHPYQNFTLELKLNLTDRLLVTFDDIKTKNGGNTTTNTSAENVTLSINITHINGTDLENPFSITVSNFTSVLLRSMNTSYQIQIDHRFNASGAIYNSTDKLYRLNITVPNNRPGGVYDVYVKINYTKRVRLSGEANSSNQEKYLVINNSGLFMSTNKSSFDLKPNSPTKFFLNITNYGPISSNSSLNSINITETCSYYSIVGSTSYAQGCTITNYNSSGNSRIYNLSVSKYSTCIVWWVINAASTGDDKSCTAYIKGEGFWFNPTGVNISVTVENTTASPTPSQPVYVANLSFTKTTPLILVQQNSSNYTDVQIHNTGNKTLNVTLRIMGINSTWFTLNNTFVQLYPNKKAGFRVNFTIGSEVIGDYSGKFNASSPDKTITSNFTLRILPAPVTQSQINDTLTLYKLDMIKLEEDINQSKKKNLNVTIAEQKLAQLKSKIAEAENYIRQGDYFSANKTLETIKNLIADIKKELSSITPVAGKGRSVWLYVGIIFGVAGIGILVYLFWPVKSGPQYKGFNLKKKNPALERLKERYKKISEEKTDKSE